MEDGKALGKSLGTVDSASLGKMLGLEDGTVYVGLEDDTILGKTEDGASLGKMLEDGKTLGWLLGTIQWSAHLWAKGLSWRTAQCL